MTSALRRLLPALLALAMTARAAEPAAPVPAATGSYPLEAYSVIGSSFAQNRRLAELGWTEAQFAAFVEGMRAAFQGKPHPVDDQARALFADIGRHLQQVDAEDARAQQEYFADPGRLESYMKEATKSFKLQRSDSGLAYGLVSPEAGAARPGPDDSVVISYTVIAADGSTDLPQLSVREKRFKLAELMPGLAEAVQMMTAKGSALLILPPDLSYGGGEWPPGVVRDTPLFFTINLHEIIIAP